MSLDLPPLHRQGLSARPADQVKAVLVSAANKSEIIVKCDKGAPAASIKETPQ
jgi:hypothetical protein